jgi:hypothetical protein
MLGFMLVLFGLTVVTILVGTHLLGRVIDRRQRIEARRLGQIHSAFVETVRRTQTIPTYTNWLSSLTPFASLDQSGLSQAEPEWGTDPTLSRAFLVDTNLPPTLLPYRQAPAGLTGSATNLLGTASRVLIVSSTKRGLALPVSSGVIASNSFNAIWNWVYAPATKDPPTGWSSWTGMGEFLHVERISLATLFHAITFKNLKYGTAGGSSVTNLITTQTTAYLLYGTSLWLATTNGTIRRSHVVTRDASFDFTGATNAGPILHYAFTETSGTVATNTGSSGSSANGLYTNGVTLGTAGPRPPSYTNYSAGNTAITLDGSNDYVRGTNGLLNNVTGLTLAGWVKPATTPLKSLDMFGQEDIAQMGFGPSDGKLEFWLADETKKLHYMYPYGIGEWHHIAGVANGTDMHIYVDAVLVASRTYGATNYGSNNNRFNVGGNVFGTGQYFPGVIDEVLVYDRALPASEILQIYLTPLP